MNIVGTANKSRITIGNYRPVSGITNNLPTTTKVRRLKKKTHKNQIQVFSITVWEDHPKGRNQFQYLIKSNLQVTQQLYFHLTSNCCEHISNTTRKNTVQDLHNKSVGGVVCLFVFFLKQEFTGFAKAWRTLQATVVFSQVKFSWIFKSRLENLKEKG